MKNTNASTPEGLVPMLETVLAEGPWFRFWQNNSGGFYTGPAKQVYVEADCEQEAGERLSDQPDYSESMCECCGPRWYSGLMLDKESVVSELLELADPEHYMNSDKGDPTPTALIIPKGGHNKKLGPFTLAKVLAELKPLTE
jgi:hypothetical protein